MKIITKLPTKLQGGKTYLISKKLMTKNQKPWQLKDLEVWLFKRFHLVGQVYH